VKRSTLLILGALIVVLFVGAYYGGLLSSVDPFLVPECYSYKFDSNYTATFSVSLHDQACLDKFGPGPYTYRWDFGDMQPAGPDTTSPTITHTFPASPNNYNMVLSVFSASTVTPASYPNQPCGDMCPFTEVNRIVLPGTPGAVIGNAPPPSPTPTPSQSPGGDIAGISVILILQIALAVVGALIAVLGLLRRRLLWIALGAGIIVFAFLLMYLV
jgi:PKD domain-containing protein